MPWFSASFTLLDRADWRQRYSAGQEATVGPPSGGAGSTSGTVSHVGPPGGHGLRSYEEAAFAATWRQRLHQRRARHDVGGLSEPEVPQRFDVGWLDGRPR